MRNSYILVFFILLTHFFSLNRLSAQCNISNTGTVSSLSNCNQSSISLGAGESKTLDVPVGALYNFTFTNNTQTSGFCVDGTRYTASTDIYLSSDAVIGMYRNSSSWTNTSATLRYRKVTPTVEIIQDNSTTCSSELALGASVPSFGSESWSITSGPGSLLSSTTFFDFNSSTSLPAGWSTHSSDCSYINTQCGESGNSLSLETYELNYVESNVFDLGGVPRSITLSLDLIDGGGCAGGWEPEGGDNFSVEWWDGSSWNSLSSFDGGTTEVNSWTNQSYTFTASNSDFKFRFDVKPGSNSTTCSSNFDSWHFDNVSLQFGQTITGLTAGNSTTVQYTVDNAGCSSSKEITVSGGSIDPYPSYTQNFDGLSTCTGTCGVECLLGEGWNNLPSDDNDWTVDANGTSSGGTGPQSGDHTSGSGNYLYTEASSSCNNSEFILETPCFYMSSSCFNLEFWYNMYSTGAAGTMGSLDLQISTNGGSSFSNLFSVSDNQGLDWKKATVSLSAYEGDNVIFRFVGNTGSNYQSDISIDDFRIFDDPSTPYIATDFESEAQGPTGCGGTQVLSGEWGNALNDDLDWVVDQSGTGSGGTGPSTGANGTSKYAYVEASSPCFGSSQESYLVSECLTMGSNSCNNIHFNYHFYTNRPADLGDLFLEVTTDGTNWSTLFSQTNNVSLGDVWNPVSVDLSAYNNQTIALRFRKVNGSNYADDVAIDEIYVNNVASSDYSPVSITSCVGNQTVYSSGQSCDAVLPDYTNNVSVDGCFFKVTQSPAPGTLLSAGNTTITMSVEDVRGNTDNCTFTVNVPTLGMPYTQNFDAFSNCGGSCNVSCSLQEGWSNLTSDDQDWSIRTGSTSSGNTGPSGDHTSGSGRYLYTEASSGCDGQQFILESPCVNISGTCPTLGFWYHMWDNGSSRMGDLVVQVSANGGSYSNVLTISGDQGNSWQEALVNLNSYVGDQISIRFIGNTGGDYRSDISIDDVSIFNNPSTTPTTINASSLVICQGETVTLSAFGGIDGTDANFEWYSGSCGGTYVGSGQSIDVTPSSTTTYYVRREGCNTTSCVNMQIDVYSPPGTANNTTSTSAICETQTKSLTASPSGGSWSIVSGGGSISGSTYTPANVSSNTSVTIRYTVPGNAGCSGSTDDVTFTVNANPATANNTTSTGAICETQTKSLTASPLGGSWSVVSGGGSISGSTYTPGNVSSNTSVTVRYTVSGNGACSGSTDDVTFTVNANPATANNTTSTGAICETQTKSLTGSPSGGSWSVISGGGSISGSTYTPANVSSNTSVTVRYTVSGNGACSGSTDDVIFTVNANPATANNTTDNSTLCEGVDRQLNGSPSGGAWSLIAGSGSISGNSYNTGSLSTDETVTVRYTVSSNGACSGSSDDVSFTANSDNNSSSTWTGAVNSDWHNPENWSNCLPGKNTNVVIPAGPSNQPVVYANGVNMSNGLGECNTIEVQSSASITVKTNAVLEVNNP
jgi:hypothetical protein